jgi:hypothetical protein
MDLVVNAGSPWSSHGGPVRTRWVLTTLLAIAAFVRLRSIGFGLPFTQARPDETVIIEAARAMLSGRLPNFYDYPWGYIALVALGYVGYFAWGVLTGMFHSLGEMVASWPVYWQPFFLISRVISATFGTASVLLAFRLGRQLRDEATGLVAALFLTFSFMHVRDSHFGTTDVAMTFFVLCAVSVLLDAHRTKRRATFAAAGLLAGLAAATKYNAVLLIIPMVISYVFTAASASGNRRAAILNGGVLFFFGAFALTFALGVPFVVLDTDRFLHAMSQLAASMRVGDPRLGLSNGWLHHLEFSLHYGMGVPLLIVGLAGVVALLWLEPGIGLVFLSFPVAYYIVAGSIRNLFFRYALPIVPFHCVTGAYLVCRSLETLMERWPARTPWRVPAQQFAVVGVSIAIVLPSAVRVQQLDRVLGATDNRVVVSQWFTENVPPGSSVLQSGSRYGLAQFDPRLGLKEWRWDGPRRAFLMDGGRPAGKPDWILVQESPLPSTTQEAVMELLKGDYELVSEFPAVSIGTDVVYDRQDAFFVPFNGLERVKRPGPNFALFKHRNSHHYRDVSAPVQ